MWSEAAAGGSHSAWPCPGSWVSLVKLCSTAISGPGHAALDEPRDDAAVLDPCRVVMAGEEERAAVQSLLDRGLLLALAQAVVARRLRLAVESDVVRVDHGVLEVVHDVAAQARDAFGSRHEDVHRAFRVRARRLAHDPGEHLVGTRELEVQQP